MPAVLTAVAAAFNINCSSNYVSYYGQNSAGSQKSLGTYCQDATEDVIVLSFMNGFPNILLNFANACETTFPGSTLLHCPSMAADIKYCQSKGKAVVLSMGGASGAYGFSSDSEATAFADTVWNKFFKGTDSQRPFDDAVLDGIDLDIEGGSTYGYAAFINQLRLHYASDPSKEYYIAAAPQCPYPDAWIGSALNSAWFDMVFVQFYNNYCGLNAYPTWFNFGDWDNWAKNSAVNKDVKIFIGAPGSPSAAGSGYVDASTLQTIFNDVRSKYSSLADPSPTIGSDCPVNGAPCTGTQQGCAGSNYAMCDNGRWVVRACVAGTYCYLNSGVAMCDWSNGRPTDRCEVPGGAFTTTTTSAPGSTASTTSSAASEIPSSSALSTITHDTLLPTQQSSSTSTPMASSITSSIPDASMTTSQTPISSITAG
ncbi:Chitinase 2, partial [Linderina pennispora]